MHTKNPKSYWKYLNSINIIHDKPQPTLQSLYEHFQSVNASKEPKEHFTTTHENELGSDLNTVITRQEINKCITNLKNGKAAGDDKILNEYIKSTKDLFLPVYEKLFNIVFDSGILPDAWLEGTIRPIYKNKGDSSLAENYRPITILSCVGKLFTAVLNNRLTDFLDNEDILQENQAGFRKGYCTSDHAFVLNSLIEIMKSSKQKLFCAFIDFSQAFDSVWRGGLWRKLLFNSIKGKFFQVIYNMYDNIKSRIKHQNEFSAFFPSDCGVRQGENLSPLLFAIYLNDLESFLLSGGVDTIDLEILSQESITYVKLLILLYADDTIIFSCDKDNFQKALENFQEYCQTWKLKINYSKTKVMIFNARRTNNFEFNIGGHNIEVTDKYKYLGVLFSKSGSFLNARKHIIEQSRKAMHLLLIRANNLDIPLDLQIKLFDNTVVPILTFGCEIWGYENTEMIERVHIEFLRKITRVRKSTPKYMIYGELGRFPLDIIIKQRMLSFWTRMLTNKTT